MNCILRVVLSSSAAGEFMDTRPTHACELRRNHQTSAPGFSPKWAIVWWKSNLINSDPIAQTPVRTSSVWSCLERGMSRDPNKV